MAVSITSVEAGTDNIVTDGGGQLLEIVGSFDLDTPHRVHVGPNGDSSDPICHAGPGLGQEVVSLDGLSLSAYLPALSAGEALSVYVQERDTPANNDLVTDALLTIDNDYSSSLFAMRALFPPNYVVGNRDMQQLSEPSRPANYVTHSEELTDTDWSVDNVTVTDTEADPLGTTRGSLLSEDGVAATTHGLEQNPTVSLAAGVHTFSIYAKAVNRKFMLLGTDAVAQMFDLETGELGTYKLESGNTVLASSIQSDHLGEDDWYRCSVTIRLNAGASVFAIGLAESDDAPGLTFDGLSQDSIRVAFPAIDLWTVPRVYRATGAEEVT